MNCNGNAILFVGNQGGLANLKFYDGMARAMREREPNIVDFYLVWLRDEREWLQRAGIPAERVVVFEDWVDMRRDTQPDPIGLERKYPDANWSAVVASERAFTDYSFLLGAVGHRREGLDYINRLIENIITCIEEALRRFSPRAVVCQTPDTIFSFCIFKVARKFAVPLYAIAPARLFEATTGAGGYFANDDMLHSERMIAAYEELKKRSLTAEEGRRVDLLISQIRDFKGKTTFYERFRPQTFSKNIVSPNIRRLFSYIKRQAVSDKDVLYTKVDPWQKLKANVLRLWRHYSTKKLMETVPLERLPQRCVLYAMHFQPEQSTLALGSYVLNQIALIENISKALPLGYTLVVKEHPSGRGRRPAWQYRHIATLPNVELCDAPAKEIARRCDLVMTISGTIGMEAAILGKPVLLFGRNFYDYGDLILTETDPARLHPLLHEVLLRKTSGFDQNELYRFLMSYLHGLIPHFPFEENAAHYGAGLLDELRRAASCHERVTA